MATNPATVAAATPAAAKPKTVLEDMAARRMFDSPTDALAYLNSLGTELSDFNEQTFVTKGIESGEDGSLNFDPAVYTSDMRVMVATLSQRVSGGPSKIAAIVITPAPTLDAILASPVGKDWLAKIADKELNHVAVRPLRNPKEGDSLDLLAEQMPTTLEGYVTTTREGGGILETFNDLARGLIDSFAKQSKQWNKARLTKPELKAAMSSRAYAAEYYPTLEDRGEGKPSMFVMALNFGKKVATEKGLDPAIFDRWLSTRDATTLTGKESDEDGDDFDIDALAFAEPEAKAATPATAAEPTAEPAAEQTAS
jgi:hypothetical protein